MFESKTYIDSTEKGRFSFCLTPFGLVLFVSALINLLLISPAISHEAKNIVVISSFSKDLPAQKAFESGLDQKLEVTTGKHNVYFEFMDVPGLDEVDFSGAFAQYLKRKYQGIQVDYVVGWADPAIKFLRSNTGLFQSARRIYVETNIQKDEENANQDKKSILVGVQDDFISSF